MILNDVRFDKYPEIKEVITNKECRTWEHICCFIDLSEDFLRDFKDKVDWRWIGNKQVLSENFIREFGDKLNWHWISKNQTLSENFIREFKDKIDWRWIGKYQILSESFIREFRDKLDWDYVSDFQILSKDFIEEFKDKINLLFLSSKNLYNLSYTFLVENIEKISEYELKRMYTIEPIREDKDKILFLKKLIFN